MAQLIEISTQPTRKFPFVKIIAIIAGVMFFCAYLIAFLSAGPFLPVTVVVCLIGGMYFPAMLFFAGKHWRTIAGEGPLNLVHTVVIIAAGVCIGLPVWAISSILILPATFIIWVLRFPMWVLGHKKWIVTSALEDFIYWVLDITFSIFLFLVGIFPIVYGEVSKKGGNIMIANHIFFGDAFLAFYVYWRKKSSVLAAAKMFYIPPFCVFLWGGRGVKLRRGRTLWERLLRKQPPRRKIAKKATRQGHKKIEQGYSLLIYPQGERSSTIGRFRSSAFVLSMKTGSPIFFLVAKLKTYTARWGFRPQYVPVDCRRSIHPENFETYKQLQHASREEMIEIYESM